MPNENTNTLSLHNVLGNTAVLDPIHNVEAAKAVGNMVAFECRAIGIAESIVSLFEKKIVDPLVIDFNDGVSHYELNLPWDRTDTDVPMSSQITIGNKGMSNWEALMAQALEATDVAQSFESQIHDATALWMFAHELGHGLSNASDLLHRKISATNSARWVYPSLNATAMLALPSEQMSPDLFTANAIESERQAEGVASLVLPHLLNEVGFSPDDAAGISTALHTLLGKSATASNSPNVIGYANPLSTEQLSARFALEPHYP